MQSGSRYVFFGFETDTVLATYLFAVIDRAVITETAAFRQLNPRFRGARLRQASASFQHGVVARVSERLDAMHGARDAAVRAQVSEWARARAARPSRARSASSTRTLAIAEPE